MPLPTRVVSLPFNIAGLCPGGRMSAAAFADEAMALPERGLAADAERT